MSSKEEIKNAFTQELKETGQYQTVLELKQIIMDLIAIPDIQPQVAFDFPEPLTDDQLNVFKMCMLTEFGFITNNISNTSVIIDMIKFLE